MSLRNFPDANTSIVLDFRKSKKLDPRITFERASNATTTPPTIGEGSGVVNGQFFEFQEDVARLTDKGLLIEEARTNLLLHSEDFTQSPWVPRRINLTTSTTPAPDGSTNAYLCTNTSTNDTVYLYRSQGSNPDVIPDGNGMAASFFVKYTNTQYAWITTGEPGKIVWFDLINGTKGTDDTDNDSGVMEPVGNGWYRCSVSVVKTSAALEEPGVGLSRTDGVLQSNQPGDSFLVWGGQFEMRSSSQGPYATSYIPTNGAEVTRAADVANMLNIDWFNASESTLVIENNAPWWNGNYAFFSVVNSSGVTTNRVSYRGTNYLASSTNGAMWASGAVPPAPSGKSYFNTLIKYAFVYDSTDAVVASSYGLGNPRSNTTGSIPVGIDQAKISQLETGVVLTAYVTRVSYYPKRLSDDSLEALTS